MRIYNITDDYINYLHQFDEKVCFNKHEKRPYIGIVLQIGDLKYYAPFTSPKQKHANMKNTIDFRKIGNGNYGAILLNNMIPVIDEALIEVDINSIQDYKYRRLLQNQYIELNNDFEIIQKNASKIRTIAFLDESELSSHQRLIKSRICNLKLLEEKYNNIEMMSNSNTRNLYLMKQFNFAYDKYLNKLFIQRIKERQMNERFKEKKLELEIDINKLKQT